MLGDLTREYKNVEIVDFYAAGPKQYMLGKKIDFFKVFIFLVTRNKNGELEYHMKIRGVRLDYINAQRLTPEIFIEVCDKLGTDQEINVPLPKPQIRKKKDYICTVEEVKRYSGVNNKGYLCNPTDDRVRFIK